MAQRAVLWSGVLISGVLLGASAPWSQGLPPCKDVPAAQRERARLAGRCEGQAPIVSVPPNARGARAPARRPVPDLRGRPFNQLDERLARYIVAIDYRESAQRRDWVIDQVPRPPALLPDGGNLRVVLSDGALVRVPDVRGNFARALTRLHRAGLSWSAGNGPAGPVLGQVPAAGAAVKPGTEVVLRLAPGPVALAPESTRPEVAPSPPRTAPPAPTAPAAPPAGSTSQPASRPPAAAAPLPQTTPAATVMPDLQGMLFDAARERMAGFNVQRIHRAGTEAGGTVIGQSPAAGTALTPGASVRLVLSDGSLVRVPRVQSFTLSEARQRLAAGELRPVIANVASDAPAGTVVGQQPGEGQFATRGSTIRLSVSAGPAAKPNTPAAAAPIEVPNVVGAPYERAQPRLDRFKIERSERAAREPAGTILEQTPAPGTKAEPGSTVAIIVSSGGRPETIEVANVVGQHTDAATAALSEFRLERDAVPSIEPAGRVLGQDPPPGAAVAPGGTVRLRVSDGTLVRTPSFAHMTLAQARDTARAAGLSVALAEGSDDGAALVRRQEPAPGVEVARGSALRVVVDERALPFNVPPAMRDTWTRASAVIARQSPRDVAIAVVVLLALLALLLVARRRPARWARPMEPVFGPTRAPATAPPERATAPRVTPVHDVPIPAAPPPAASRPVAPRPIAPRRVGPRLGELRAKVAAPVEATPSKVAAPAPEPVVFSARARLDADPAATVAPTATPRGPEIRIAARLEPGDGFVRELPAENAPDETGRGDEMSEETR